MEQLRARNRQDSSLGKPSQHARSSGSGELERSRKIARIRRAIKAGRYRVESSDVAGKLIEHMLRPLPSQ